MTHSDDDGLVLPPRIASQQIVILPIYKSVEDKQNVLEYCMALKKVLSSTRYHHLPLRVHVDDREMRGGEKTWQWVKKGVPIRLEVGPRDMEHNSVFMARRDQSTKEKVSIGLQDFIDQVTTILDEIQNALFMRAQTFRDSHIHEVSSLDEFNEFFNEDQNISRGFVSCYAVDDKCIEDFIKPLKVTARCIPLTQVENSDGKCIFTGKPVARKMIFAKAY